MTMSDDLTLLDANVLVYAFFPASEYYGVSRKILESAFTAEAGLCVTSQVLAEFFSVVTNPKRVLRPRSPEEAIEALETILALPGVSILPAPADVPRRWIELMRRRPATGAEIFDRQLIATMLANGVRRIYTFNRPDFEGFEELTVLAP